MTPFDYDPVVRPRHARREATLGWQPSFGNLGLTIGAYEWYVRHWHAHRLDGSFVLEWMA